MGELCSISSTRPYLAKEQVRDSTNTLNHFSGSRVQEKEQEVFIISAEVFSTLRGLVKHPDLNSADISHKASCDE